MWLRELSSCSCLTDPPGPAWVLLSKTYTYFSSPLYNLGCNYFPFKNFQGQLLPQLLLYRFGKYFDGLKDMRDLATLLQCWRQLIEKNGAHLCQIAKIDGAETAGKIERVKGMSWGAHKK